MKAETAYVEAFDVRGFTASAASAYNRRNTKFSVLFVDLYNAALTAAVVLALSGSTVYAVREQLVEATANERQAPVDERWAVIPPVVLLALCVMGALLAVLIFARRLGPISVGRVESQWWLPLPVARRPLVAAPFAKRLVLLACAATASHALFSVLTLLEAPVLGHVAGAIVFGVLAAAAMLLAAAVQVDKERRRRRTALAVGVLLPAAMLPPAAGSGLLWPIVPAIIIAVGTWWYVSPRLSGIPAAELTRGGAVAGHVQSAAFLMNTNELVQALGAGSGTDQPSVRRRTRLFDVRPRSAAGSLLQADITAFLRVRRWWLPLLLWLLPPLAAMLAEQAIPIVLQLGILLVSAAGATSSAGAVARRTSDMPGLDRLLPLGQGTVASIRMAMPAVAMMAWLTTLTSVLAFFGIADWRLALLGAIAGAGLAGSTLRSAYRPVPDWSQPPVETPFGPVPRTQLSALTSGMDALVIAMVPLLLAVYLDQVTGLLLVIQVGASAVSWIAGIISLSRRR